MDNYNSRSRVNKFEKRRKNTKAITILAVIGSILVIFLLVVFVFGGKNDKATKIDQNDPITENNEAANSVEDEPDDEANSYPENDEDANPENNEEEDSTEGDRAEDDPNDDTETVEYDTSDDDNILSAFSKDWNPVGTEQSEPHVVQYDEGSKDRTEMERAIRLATGLDDMITWWLGNDGDQKIVATVSSNDQTENYRVYISWITNEGWQPTKVEVLKVNDKHPDYEDDQEDED